MPAVEPDRPGRHRPARLAARSGRPGAARSAGTQVARALPPAQPGVAFARFRRTALAHVEARLDELLSAYGVIVTAYCWCPHHASGRSGALACTCRKPRPGLLLEAAKVHGIALDRSWMIGDILDDVEAGTRAGCKTILVDRGGETRWRGGRMRTPNAIVYDFADAASLVVDGTRVSQRADATAARG